MKKHVLFIISLLALEVSGVLAQMNPSPAVPPSSAKTDTMMMQCTDMMSMMSMMQGEGMGGMSSGDSMMGQGEMGDQASSEMMEQADSLHYDQASAEALARAFLSGRSPATLPIVIEQIVLANSSYTVSYQKGVSKGTLTVDAITGEVKE